MATSAIQVDFDEAAAPATPGTGKVRLYAKTDGLLYSKDDVGTETVVTGGGASGGFAYSGAKAVRSTTQTLTHNTAAAVQLNATDEWDDGGWHDPASNNTRMTVPAGVSKVRCTAAVDFVNNATGDRSIYFQKNGGAPGTITERAYVRASANWITVLSLTVDIAVTAGDYIELFAFQDSGGNLNLQGASFSIMKIDD